MPAPHSRLRLARLLVVLLLASGLLGGVPQQPTAAAADEPVRPPTTVMRTLQGLETSGSGRAAGLRQRSNAARTPIPFTMVGFDVPTGASVDFRTSSDGRTWTAWEHAPTFAQEGEAVDPAKGGPAWASSTEPVWVGDARFLQLDVRGGTPADVQVHLLETRGRARSLRDKAADAVASAGRSLTGDVAHAAMARPRIVRRTTWGAGKSAKPRYHGGVRAATLHHTAGRNSYTCKDGPGIVKAIWNYHTKRLGWGDIGYHFVIDKCGRIYEGRAGGMDRAVLGAHAGGFNANTFGVSILGEFTSSLPSPEAREAVAQVVAWKFSQHRVRPNAQVTLTSAGNTKYRKGRKVTLPVLFGHRDVSKTTCPGNRLYRELPAIRQRVSRLVATHGFAPLPQTAPTPTPTPTVEPDPPTIVVGGSNNRTRGVPLHDQAVSGLVYVWSDWTDPRRDTDRVEFRVDAPLRAPPEQVAHRAPYELGWFDTRPMANGVHMVTIRVVRRNANDLVSTATFTVDNPVPSG